MEKAAFYAPVGEGLGLAGYNSCRSQLRRDGTRDRQPFPVINVAPGFSVIQRADKLCPQRIGDWTYVAVLNDEAGKGQFLDMH